MQTVCFAGMQGLKIIKVLLQEKIAPKMVGAENRKYNSCSIFTTKNLHLCGENRGLMMCSGMQPLDILMAALFPEK